jgi:hypothetical protein
MSFLDGAALIVGAALIISGVRAIRCRRAEVSEADEGSGVVRLGWLWIGLGGGLSWLWPSMFPF